MDDEIAKMLRMGKYVTIYAVASETKPENYSSLAWMSHVHILVMDEELRYRDDAWRVVTCWHPGLSKAYAAYWHRKFDPMDN